MEWPPRRHTYLSIGAGKSRFPPPHGHGFQNTPGLHGGSGSGYLITADDLLLSHRPPKTSFRYPVLVTALTKDWLNNQELYPRTNEPAVIERDDKSVKTHNQSPINFPWLSLPSVQLATDGRNFTVGNCSYRYTICACCAKRKTQPYLQRSAELSIRYLRVFFRTLWSAAGYLSPQLNELSFASSTSTS